MEEKLFNKDKIYKYWIENLGQVDWYKCATKDRFLKFKDYRDVVDSEISFEEFSKFIKEFSREEYHSKWTDIDINNCPRDLLCTLYNPNDEKVCVCTNPIEVLYVRTEIKKMSACGFYFVLDDGIDTIINIDCNGTCDNYPDGFDQAYMNLCCKML